MLGGPIWNQQIHDLKFAQRLLDKVKQDDCTLGTKPRIKGVLGGILDEEVCANIPLSYDLSQVASNVKVENPKKHEIINGFRSLDYKLC